MKKRIIQTLFILLLVSTTMFVSGCSLFNGGLFSCSSKFKVSIQYNKSQGTIKGAGEYKAGVKVNLVASAKEGYEFDGWYSNTKLVKSDATFSFKMPKSNISYIAKFKNETLYNLNVTYDSTQGTVTGAGSYAANKNVTLVAEPKGGYVFDGWFNGEDVVSYDATYSFAMTKGDLSLEAKFSVDTGDKSLTINYIYSDNTQAFPSVSKSLKYGDTYYVSSPSIVGYSCDKVNVSGTIAKNTLIVVTYTPIDYSVTINFKNEAGDSVGTSLTKNIKYNTEYSFTAPNLEKSGYYLEEYNISGILNTEDKYFADILSVATSKNISLNVIYVKSARTLTVKYVDEDGNSIASSTTINKNIGETYSVNAITIPGYSPIDTVLTGKVTASYLQEIVFVYKAQKCKLTINYVYASNLSKAADSYVGDFGYNSNYSITSPTLAGYTADKLVVDGKITSDTTITVKYTQIKVTLTINYVYQNNTQAYTTYSNQYAYNDSYSITSPSITGYSPDKAVVEGTVKSSDDITVKVIYRVASYKLTINYISSVSGFNEIKPDTVVKYVYYNSNYSVQSPTLAGLVADKPTVTGTMLDKDITVNVTYSKSQVILGVSHYYMSGSNKAYLGNNSAFYVSYDDPNKTKIIDLTEKRVYNKLGYRCIFSSLILKIVGANFQLIGVQGGTQTTIYNFPTNLTSYQLEYTPIMSIVTVKHRLDKSTIFTGGVETYTGQCGQVINIDYKDYGEYYEPAGTTYSYTFGETNETVFLEYTSIERTLTINYLDEYGSSIYATYSQTYKYNSSYSITSPTITDYVLKDSSQAVIEGTMGSVNITVNIIYKLDWDIETTETIIIDSALKLLELSKNSALWSRSVKITKNIDMTGHAIAPIGNFNYPFTGNVDGGNFTISNISIDTSKITIRTQVENSVTYKFAYVGLFGYSYGTIKNLTLDNISYEYSLLTSENTTLYAGLLVGQYSGPSITNVTIKGSMNVSAKVAYLGGVAGSSSSRTISAISSNVTINGTSSMDSVNVGGIFGYNYLGTIQNSSATLTITSMNTVNKLSIGGIVGESKEGLINSSTGQINVTGATCQNASITRDNICGLSVNTIINS